MRWLPYPTCRLPLRRFISLSLAFALSGAPAVVQAAVQETPPTAPPPTAQPAPQRGPSHGSRPFSLCPPTTLPEDQFNQKVQEKIDGMTRDYESKSATHRREPLVANSAKFQKELLEHLQVLTMALCTNYRHFASAVETYGTQVTALAGEQNRNCARFHQVQQMAVATNQAMASLSKHLEEDLQTRKNYMKNVIERNKKDIEAVGAAIIRQSTENPSVSPYALTETKGNLEREFDALWKTDADKAKLDANNYATRRDFNDKAVFGKIVSDLDKVQRDFEVTKSEREAYSTQLGTLNGNCGSLTGQTPPTAPAQPGQQQRENPQASQQPGATAPGSQRECNIQVDGSVVTLDPDPNCKIPGTDGRRGSVRDDRTTDDLSGTKRTPEKKDEDDPTKKSPPERNETPVTPPKKEESWISKNSDLLIMGGVGAAAVGGLIYYLKTEDDKKKDKANDMELEAAAAAMTQQQQASNNSSGDSSSGDGSSTDSFAGGAPAAGQTPQGSTLMVEGTPAGASANQTITSFVVKVVGPNGVMTQDSATDITVSCMTPVPCGLEGTLTVNTEGGKAEFKDIRLKTPNSGVRLQFNAPGFQSVGSSSFDVSNQ